MRFLFVFGDSIWDAPLLIEIMMITGDVIGCKWVFVLHMFSGYCVKKFMRLLKHQNLSGESSFSMKSRNIRVYIQ